MSTRQLRQHDEGPVATAKPKVAPKAKKLDYKPFTGKEDLPPYEIRHGKTVLAEPRFFINRAMDNPKKFKLIAVYRTPTGVERRLWRVLKPYDKPTDKEFMGRLKASGITIGF